MSKDFSVQIKQDLIDYFQNQHGISISDEEAQSYLHSLADIYLSFSAETSENEAEPTQNTQMVGSDSLVRLL